MSHVFLLMRLCSSDWKIVPEMRVLDIAIYQSMLKSCSCTPLSGCLVPNESKRDCSVPRSAQGRRHHCVSLLLLMTRSRSSQRKKSADYSGICNKWVLHTDGSDMATYDGAHLFRLCVPDSCAASVSQHVTSHEQQTHIHLRYGWIC